MLRPGIAQVKRIILETRQSLGHTRLMKMIKSPMHYSEQLLRAKGPVKLEFDQLGLKLRKGAVVLDGVSGAFEPRKLIAIMGPSGAGKSTFLNVLCGKAASYGKMTGVLKVNGKQAREPTPDRTKHPQRHQSSVLPVHS